MVGIGKCSRFMATFRYLGSKQMRILVSSSASEGGLVTTSKLDTQSTNQPTRDRKPRKSHVRTSCKRTRCVSALVILSRVVKFFVHVGLSIGDSSPCLCRSLSCVLYCHPPSRCINGHRRTVRVTLNKILRVDLRWTSILSRESSQKQSVSNP